MSVEGPFGEFEVDVSIFSNFGRQGVVGMTSTEQPTNQNVCAQENVETRRDSTNVEEQRDIKALVDPSCVCVSPGKKSFHSGRADTDFFSFA
jgi:hypothetical protein